MRVFITGATGFVGASLVRYFARQGHTVIASARTNDPPLLLKKYAQYIPWHIEKGPLPVKADLAIHVAALAADEGKWQLFYDANVTGTANFMLSVKDCPKVVIISSSSVYNFNSHAATEEEDILPDELPYYGRSKYLAEIESARLRNDDQQVMVLRPRAIYGIGDRILLPKLLKLEKGGFLICPVKEKIKTSLTHIRNIEYAISLFLNSHIKKGHSIYNISDGQEYKLKEVILKLHSNYSGKKLPVVAIPPAIIKPLVKINSGIQFSKALSPMMWNIISKDAVVDISMIKHDLGFNPVTDFDASIREVAEWANKFGSKKSYFTSLQHAPWMFVDDQYH